MLTGTYKQEDAIFLLKELTIGFTDLVEKERLIQSGRSHYSEMIHFEPAPDPEYLKMFRELTRKYAPRLASELVSLSAELCRERTGEITLVSLARAGTPTGALMARTLKERFGKICPHYSVSIIRDRGIDMQALRYILMEAKHAPESVVFVDGWTAKGVITAELEKSVASWNEEYPQLAIDPGLWVISDIGGTAKVAGTAEDYAMPFGILNAPVCGLVSRSILNRDHIGPDDFHGTVLYEHLKPYDLTNWFLDEMIPHIRSAEVKAVVKGADLCQNRARIQAYLAHLQTQYGCEDINLIKPGVAEATRVMMRRIPELLILRNPGEEDVVHLRLLAQQKSVPIEVNPDSPIRATALIKRVKEKNQELKVDVTA